MTNALKQFSKRERIIICKQWLKDRVNWNEVVFTDEKRFNLDGPENWQSYHRLGKKVLRKNDIVAVGQS